MNINNNNIIIIIIIRQTLGLRAGAEALGPDSSRNSPMATNTETTKKMTLTGEVLPCALRLADKIECIGAGRTHSPELPHEEAHEEACYGS